MLPITRWEERMQALLREYGVAGLAVAVSDREKTVWHGAYGVTSVEKPWDRVTTDTLFRIASCTKMITGMAAMHFAERGLLDLDAPVQTYAPWLHMADDRTLPRITVRRLLSHTAGLPAEYTPDGPHDEDRLIETVRAGFCSLRPIADPDDRLYYYSNWGVRLVACILETISGERYPSLAERLVLHPLGMTHSTFALCKAATFSLAVPHGRGPAVLHNIPVNATRHAAGGLCSTVDDMARLARVLLNDGAPLVSAGSMREMTTPEADLYLDYKSEYGLTLRMRQYKDVVLTGHGGSSPPYYAGIWAAREQGYAVTVALNTEGAQSLTDRIPELIFDDLLGLPATWECFRPCATVPAADRSAVEAAQTGTYLSDAYGLVSLDVRDGVPTLTLDGTAYPLTPLEKRGVYRLDRGGKGISVGLPAVNGGSAAHLFLQSMLCPRVEPKTAPDPAAYAAYTGAYGTLWERFSVRTEGETLYVAPEEGAAFPCRYVMADAFSSVRGAVYFMRTDGVVTGLRVGSSTVYNKVR